MPTPRSSQVLQVVVEIKPRPLKLSMCMCVCRIEIARLLLEFGATSGQQSANGEVCFTHVKYVNFMYTLVIFL